MPEPKDRLDAEKSARGLNRFGGCRKSIQAGPGFGKDIERVTFGVCKGSKQFIHLREDY